MNCSDKRPIIFVARALRAGGAERQLALTCHGLHSRGIPVNVLTFYGNGSLGRHIAEDGIQVVVVGKKSRWDVIGFSKKLLSIIWAQRPVLAYGYLGAANIVCAVFKLIFPGMKVIWSVRASRMDLKNYDWIWRLEKVMMRILTFLPDKIVVNSQAGFSELARQGYPQCKILVVRNGVDTKLFRPCREEGIELRKRWTGSGWDGKLVGMVARLDPIKDHETFLAAASILLQRRKDVKFVCVGPDWAERSASLRQMAESLGLAPYLFWEGERDDMASVYNALDILTLCSTSEGFPNAVAEAMACGVPCVATDVGDCAFLVGNTGIIVPPKDPVALAGAWEKCLGMDLEQMGKLARERIVKHFTVDKMVDETIKVFEEALGRPLERWPAASNRPTAHTVQEST